MLQKSRGKVDPPIYAIQICIPKHGFYELNLLIHQWFGVGWSIQIAVPNSQGFAKQTSQPLERGKSITV
ncbi:ATP phosphoribosyltransferase 2 chloroplastic [Bienertia sinuspersici]